MKNGLPIQQKGNSKAIKQRRIKLTHKNQLQYIKAYFYYSSSWSRNKLKNSTKVLGHSDIRTTMDLRVCRNNRRFEAKRI
jgi:hypothetical protein